MVVLKYSRKLVEESTGMMHEQQRAKALTFRRRIAQKRPRRAAAALLPHLIPPPCQSHSRLDARLTRRNAALVDVRSKSRLRFAPDDSVVPGVPLFLLGEGGENSLSITFHQVKGRIQ